MKSFKSVILRILLNPPSILRIIFECKDSKAAISDDRFETFAAFFCVTITSHIKCKLIWIQVNAARDVNANLPHFQSMECLQRCQTRFPMSMSPLVFLLLLSINLRAYQRLLLNFSYWKIFHGNFLCNFIWSSDYFMSSTDGSSPSDDILSLTAGTGTCGKIQDAFW